MAIFNSYVSSPEGIRNDFLVSTETGQISQLDMKIFRCLPHGVLIEFCGSISIRCLEKAKMIPLNLIIPYIYIIILK